MSENKSIGAVAMGFAHIEVLESDAHNGAEAFVSLSTLPIDHAISGLAGLCAAFRAMHELLVEVLEQYGVDPETGTLIESSEVIAQILPILGTEPGGTTRDIPSVINGLRVFEVNHDAGHQARKK